MSHFVTSCNVLCFPFFILMSLLLPKVNPYSEVTDLPPMVNFTCPVGAVTHHEYYHADDFYFNGYPFLYSENGASGACYIAGFFPEDVSDRSSDQDLFLSVLLAFRDRSGVILNPLVIWSSANQEDQFHIGLTLELTKEDVSEFGDVFADVLGLSNSKEWLACSSNTTDKLVARLYLTETGNLILFDSNNSVIWESFKHASDILVPGQKLFPGQKLISKVSKGNNLSSTQVAYSLSVTEEGASAFIATHPTEPYYNYKFQNSDTRHLEFGNVTDLSTSHQILQVDLRSVPNQYLQLRPDGYLKLYEYPVSGSDGVGIEIADVFGIDECTYPLVCGTYGICKYRSKCSCPLSIPALTSTNHFIPVSEEFPEKGCSAITPITCNASTFHTLIELKDVGYFSHRFDIVGTSLATCKDACLKNCSCKLAVFSRNGDCHLASDVVSLIGNYWSLMGSNVTAYIKVQLPEDQKSNNHQLIAIVTVSGCFFILVAILGGACFIARKKTIAVRNQQNQLNLYPVHLDQVAGTRFSYDELNISTTNFSKKLGQGGFGSVYEGVLKNGMKVAVKRLHGKGSEEKSFLAEVESIGRIHHLYLVKLVGFCVERDHCYLVYDYMANGSLDKWIYSRGLCLSWACRRKILQDVAKGLAYLHEECRQKVVHLDVKPQNILLDEDLNAKLSDFGLAKLIDRNQSKAVTMVRGTPGYLAPEWLNGVVTEKVDVYSFGIVVMEMVCGRKHFDESKSEESQHLLSLLKAKAEEGALHELVDSRSNDMKYHLVQGVEMIKLAIWCLQMDRSKRPSMSMVVKFLDGVIEIEETLDYSQLSSLFVTPMELENRVHIDESIIVVNSVLTGPR